MVVVNTPGHTVRSRQAALQLPELGRYLHGRRDARLVRLGRLCQRPEALPRLDGDTLDATDCEPAHLEAELHRLAHDLAPAYAGAGLPALIPADDDHARQAVIGCAAAAPLWQLALHALAELDATFVVLGADDLAAWDAAVAAPLAGWATDDDAAAAAAPDAPSLRALVHDTIDAHRAALVAQLAWTDDDGARHALAELWDRALGVATHGRDRPASHLAAVIASAPAPADALALVRALGALSTLRDAITTRRRALIALGVAVDRAAEQTPLAAIAIALAARLVIAHALVGGVADWLADLAPVPAANPTLTRIRSEAARVAAVEAGLARFFPETQAAVAALIGMAP